MAWTMAAVRSGLKTRLATISGLTVYDTWPSAPVVPGALIAPATDNPVDYDDSMEGAATLRLVVTVLVQKVVESVAQNAADEYLNFTGSKSIAAAVNSAALANAWEYVAVRGAARYGQYEFGSAETALRYLGVEFNLVIGVY